MKLSVTEQKRFMDEVPTQYRNINLTGLQNYIVYSCRVPSRINKLMKLTTLGERAMCNQLDVLIKDKHLTEHDYFDGHIYYESAISFQNKSMDNQFLYDFSGNPVTELMLIHSLLNPEANIHTMSKRLTGLLAYHMLQSYYVELESSTNVTEPSLMATKIELEQELARLRMFVDFMQAIHDGSNWEATDIKFQGKVVYDIYTLQMLKRLSVEWQQLYFTTHTKDDNDS